MKNNNVLKTLLLYFLVFLFLPSCANKQSGRLFYYISSFKTNTVYAEDAVSVLSFDDLFAAPSKSEIDNVYKKMIRKYACVDFTVQDNVYNDSNITVDKITYKSDGLKITGLLAKPKIVNEQTTDMPQLIYHSRYDPIDRIVKPERGKTSKLPLLMFNHGGFSGITKYDTERIFYFAQKNFVVLASTYRGEEGIAGQSEGSVEVMKGEVDDVLNLLECGRKLNYVDKDKIAMLGGSHGGGITLSAAVKSQDISASIVFAGPTNQFDKNSRATAEAWKKNPKKQEMLLSLFMTQQAMDKMKSLIIVESATAYNKTLLPIGTQTVPIGDTGELGTTYNKTLLQQRRDELISRSPLFFIEHLNSPLLFFYGNEDPAVSVQNAHSLAEKLTQLGKKFEYKIYENQGHSLKDEFKQEAYETVDKFLSSTLGGQAQRGQTQKGQTRRSAPTQKITLKLPFDGEMYVIQGNNDMVSHTKNSGNEYAWDFTVMKNGKLFKDNAMKSENYFCWGQDVLSPATGTIIKVVNNNSDHPPMTKVKNNGNYVWIDHSNKEISRIYHFMQDSITVKVGDMAGTGQILGRCGNSGHSLFPHIHYQLDKFDKNIGYPVKVHFQGTGSPVITTDDTIIHKPFSAKFSNYISKSANSTAEKLVESGIPLRGEFVKNRN